MKKQLLCLSIIIAFIALPNLVSAQDWVSKMHDPNVNFFEVQKTFYKYYNRMDKVMERERKRASKKKGEARTESDDMEVPGYFQYKRWEWLMAPRVDEDGNRFDPAATWKEYRRYREQYKTVNAGTWSLIGPSTSVPVGGGAGRLNFVRIHPGNSNIIYVGSPAGGLWKSTNGGTTWTTNTDQLSQVIGCTDIAIDPTNTDIMYLATGDGDAGDTYTVGLLKSTDGGNTWNPSGLSYKMANYRQLSKVLINPNSTNIILVATSAGIYRSDDSGLSFTQTLSTGSFKDMEFSPNDPNIVYCSGTEFYKWVNGGQSWTKITSGLPLAATLCRMAIAVTPADPTIVYMIAGLAAPAYGTDGFYKSTNSGSSFTKISTPGGLGNQQWYDLAIASSPTNANEVVVCGQTDIMRSVNGGATWASNSGFTHVDYHDIVYVDANSYYLTSDGGVYKTTNSGSTWTDLSDGLQIAQMYGFGQSASNANWLLQGWQDNGTNRYDGTTWEEVLGGDGMLCFIDWSNDQNMWGEQYNGSLNKSTNGGNSWSSADAGITEAGAWVTPWLQDPNIAQTIYVGMINVWKSLNGGTSWTKISAYPTTSTINTLAISPANSQVIWVAKPEGMYKTSNGGTNWTTITSIPTGTITGITCSESDPNKAWITYSGFNNTSKVFQTNDQGLTWINLSASIPNIPVNCIVNDINSNDGLYIGTDVGVFYKDASMTVWQPFFNGLPNVIVTQLAIFIPTGKLRASTYGRGIWESDLYVAGSYPPVSAFGSDNRISCPGAAVQFSDYSSGQPTSWNWTFTGGTPSTSTLQNPVVYYNTAGAFPVSLTTNNANGTDAITTNDYISIASSPFANPSTIGAGICGPGQVNLTATSSTGQGVLRWWDSPGGGNIVATGTSYSPTITGTTTYYVDEDFPNGGVADIVGEFDYQVGAGAYFTANDIRGMYFDVLQTSILNSFEVYPNSAGNRTFEVLDSDGNTILDTTIFLPASPNTPVTVTINWTLYPGTNYFIKCRGTVDLWRNSAGAVYPYTSTSINITNSNAGSNGYYYFFYTWNYTTIVCNTGRTPCTATDVCASIKDIAAIEMMEIFPNPNKGEFTLKFNVKTADNYQLKITNALGQVVYQEKLNSFAGAYDKKLNLQGNKPGVYILSISNSANETVREIVIN